MSEEIESVLNRVDKYFYDYKGVDLILHHDLQRCICALSENREKETLYREKYVELVDKYSTVTDKYIELKQQQLKTN